MGGVAIRTVMRSGRRSRTRALEFYWQPNHVGHPRLGLVVPRFRATAVARNRLRRRLREILRRRIAPRMPPLDFVVRTRAKAYEARFTGLAADLEQWLFSISDRHAGHAS